MSNTLPFASMADIVRSGTPGLTRRAPDMDPLGNQTFYTVHVNIPGHIREYTMETETLETEAEVLRHLQDVPDDWPVKAIFRIDFDVPRRDAMEDIALLWLQEFDDEDCDLPAFITDNLSEDQLAQHFAERDEVRAYRREIASPELSGRI